MGDFWSNSSILWLYSGSSLHGDTVVLTDAMHLTDFLTVLFWFTLLFLKTTFLLLFFPTILFVHRGILVIWNSSCRGETRTLKHFYSSTLNSLKRTLYKRKNEYCVSYRLWFSAWIMAAGKKDTLTLETTRKAVCLKAVILQWISCGGEKSMIECEWNWKGIC